jgi:hypothetical protein
MPDADMSTADGKGNDPEPAAVTAGNPGAPRGLWAKRSVRAAAALLSTAGRGWALDSQPPSFGRMPLVFTGAGAATWASWGRTLRSAGRGGVVTAA